MGPKAGGNQWESPVKKYVARATAIGSAHPPLSAGVYMYNTQATTVLQYVTV